MRIKERIGIRVTDRPAGDACERGWASCGDDEQRTKAAVSWPQPSGESPLSSNSGAQTTNNNNNNLFNNNDDKAAQQRAQSDATSSLCRTFTAPHRWRNLFIQPVHGTPVVIQASSHWTVHDLKLEVMETLYPGQPLDTSELRLLHGGRELQQAQAPVALYGLLLKQDDSTQTVHCTLRLHGGKKTKSKGGKSHKKGARQQESSELLFKEEGQLYAQVTALLGSSRLRVACDDGKERLCTIRGKLVRRAWVSVRDVVLVSLREWDRDDDKCDMIGKYSHDEARRLAMYKELPASFTTKEEAESGGIPGEADDDGIEFTFGDEEVDIDSL